MNQVHEDVNVEQKVLLKCYQCKYWTAVVQPHENPQDTYTDLIRERNSKGRVMGACTFKGGFYPMFDIEECKLKDEYKHLAERI